MKTQALLRAVCSAAALLAGGAALASTVTSAVGELDNFKLAAPAPVLMDGDTFDSFGYPEFMPGADPLVTDRWVAVDGSAVTALEVQHSYGFNGTVLTASLELLSAGWGYYGRASVYVNGVFVGLLSDGDDEITNTEFVRLDVFDLTPLLGSLNLTGNDAVEVRTVAGAPGDILDFGVLDYSRLTVTTDSTAAAPEPGTTALLAAALAAAALLRRRHSR